MQACGVSLRRLLRPVALICDQRLGRHLVRAHRARPRLQPDVSRDRSSTSPANAPKARSSRAFLHRLPQLRALRPRHPAGRAAGTACSWPTCAPISARRSTSPAAAGCIDRQAQHRIDMELDRRHSAQRRRRTANTTCHTFERAGSKSIPRRCSRTSPAKNPRQMSIAELRAQIANGRAWRPHGALSHPQRGDGDPPALLHPGRLSRLRPDRSGPRRHPPPRRRLGSFVIGIVVVFAYYVPLMLGPSLVKGQLPFAVAGQVAAELRPRRARDPDVRLARPPGGSAVSGFRCRSGCVGSATARGRTMPGLAILWTAT